MTEAKDKQTSPLADLFLSASVETRRAFFKTVISKAIASQREVSEKADAIRKARKSAAVVAEI